MVTRAEFIEEVKTYEGTNYRHQGRTKGVHVDCIGLIVCPLQALGWDLSYVPNTYRRIANPIELMVCLYDSNDVYTISFEESKPGDIVLLNIRGHPRHFGVLLDKNQFIHSYYKQSVVVTDFTNWKIMLHSVWRIKFDDEVI